MKLEAFLIIFERLSLQQLKNFFWRWESDFNEGSGQIVKLIKSQYINISTYRPLSGISRMKLPVELKSPKKGLINIKNNDQKYLFMVSC